MLPDVMASSIVLADNFQHQSDRRRKGRTDLHANECTFICLLTPIVGLACAAVKREGGGGGQHPEEDEEMYTKATSGSSDKSMPWKSKQQRNPGNFLLFEFGEEEFGLKLLLLLCTTTTARSIT